MLQNLAESEPVVIEPIAQPATTRKGQKHFRVSEPDLPANTFSGRLIRTVEELESLVPSWNRLLETAVRVNPYFDPDFLIPAVLHLGGDNLSVLVVEARQRVNANAPPVMCALLPIIEDRIYGLPFKCLQIWLHDLCLDRTPLIRCDCAAEVLEFMFNFIGAELGASLFSMNTIVGEGPLANLITDNVYQNDRSVFHRDEFTRSCFKPMENAEAFINTKVAKNTRKGSQRLRRKLASQGNLQTGFLQHFDRLWVDQFLSLESAGWKGANGTALASNSSTRQFFHEMARRMLENNRMVIARTTLDNRPIAMFCDLQSATHAAHFKTTFDETLKEFSPGLFAELDNIHRLHESNIQFVDSCADPDHSMINRVWPDRVRFQSLVVAVRGPVSQTVVSAMPLMQQLWKLFNNR